MPDNPNQPHTNVEALSKRAEALLVDLAELVNRVNEIRRLKSPGQINHQLRAIGDSIRKLERLGVPIPDDLRKLKISLTSDLCKLEEVERIRAKVSEQLGVALARLGASYCIPNHQAPQPVTRGQGRKKKVQDENIIDLFDWKKSAGGST